MPTPPELDHLGIAVHSIAKAKDTYALLGLELTAQEEVAHEQIRTATLRLKNTQLELIEPTSDDSTIARFLARQGEGLHHVAIRVPDLDARFHSLQQANVPLASSSIQRGVNGHRYFFLHPKATHGLLIELVGD